MMNVRKILDTTWQTVPYCTIGSIHRGSARFFVARTGPGCVKTPTLTLRVTD